MAYEEEEQGRAEWEVQLEEEHRALEEYKKECEWEEYRKESEVQND